ncbi:MAG: class IV adenylate cyclase [Tepidisphaeraceae bacterium]
MSVEIEVKIRVPDHDAIRARLSESGAQPLGNHFETNTFFDTRDNALLAGDRGLRVRVSRDVRTGQSVVTLTHKGPRQSGEVKSREETELIVQREDHAAALLGCLGYRQVLAFEKRRESWMFHNCRVELDEIPRVGKFVEIEGPTESEVIRIRDELGLKDHPQTKPSYAALIMSMLQQNGIMDRTVRF